VITRLDLRRDTRDPRGLLPRADGGTDAATEAVRDVIDAVRNRGSTAVREFSKRFDGVEPPQLRVPADVIASALAELDPAVRDALAEAILRVRAVHDDQRRHSVTSQVAKGGTVTERWVPVGRVGLYVPGGLAVYPSSVVMNVVPARVAGVEQVVVCSPPQRESGRYQGWPHPTVLAACGLLGVDEVYAVGGAQAIAMLAYGYDRDSADETAEGCPPVDVITGPGNMWVTAAKRLLRGIVGIDAEAGPTEIAILADETADASHVAADLISQAEHDPLAAAVLVTTSPELADAVDAELAGRVAATKHTERIRESLSGKQSRVVLVADLNQGLRVVDAYAAEHLEIQTRDASEVAMRVRNAGAIFVGPHSPVSLGDYCAGSNHVLPTGGCARHSSGLSVQTFLRGIQVIEYTEQALAEVAHHIYSLADAEDLPAHGEAVAARFSGDPR
jgi:histidinol dehydrogenase